MGQILHGSATPTAAVRRAIQASQESLRVLAKRYGINRKAVAQGKHCTACRLARKIPNQRCSPLRTKRSSLLSVGVCCCRGMIAFTPCKHLSRSAVPRCLQRHRISRLPDVQGDRPDKKKFRSCPRGCFHIDLAGGPACLDRILLSPGVALPARSQLSRSRTDILYTRR